MIVPRSAKVYILYEDLEGGTLEAVVEVSRQDWAEVDTHLVVVFDSDVPESVVPHSVVHGSLGENFSSPMLLMLFLLLAPAILLGGFYTMLDAYHCLSWPECCTRCYF